MVILFWIYCLALFGIPFFIGLNLRPLLVQLSLFFVKPQCLLVNYAKLPENPCGYVFVIHFVHFGGWNVVLKSSRFETTQATTSWLSSAPLRAAASGAFASLLVHYKAGSWEKRVTRTEKIRGDIGNG